MSLSASAGRTGERAVVGVFEHDSGAREAIRALGAAGVSSEHVGTVAPGERLSVSTQSSATAGPLWAAASAAPSDDVSSVLAGLGVPDGEARYYAAQSREGRTLVVVEANGRSDEIRRVLRAHGGTDVESQGGEFIRGSGTAAAARTTLPVDVTRHWPDFRSRYLMLWQQHYGTTDATFEQVEPIYQLAWQLANDPRYRGRAWPAVEASIRDEWSNSSLASRFAWADAQGPIRDVWEDVAQEAATGAEGGADRRIAHQGADQSVAARDLGTR